MGGDKEIFERIYEEVAVWTETEPPTELVTLIESAKIEPCKVLDVGCGEGFYDIYLASRGFEVTGIDISENAIKLATENSMKQSVKIKFMSLDVADLNKINDTNKKK